MYSSLWYTVFVVADGWLQTKPAPSRSLLSCGTQPAYLSGACRTNPVPTCVLAPPDTFEPPNPNRPNHPRGEPAPSCCCMLNAKPPCTAPLRATNGCMR